LNNLSYFFLQNQTVLEAIKKGIFIDYCWDQDQWDNTTSCNASDTWTREVLLKKGQSLYFISVIQMKWACLFVAKTRFASIFTQGILNNYVLLGAFVFETFLAAFIVYVPGIEIIFSTSIVLAQWLAMFFPWFMLVFCLDEGRKFFLRHEKDRIGGYFWRHTYY